MRSRYGAGGVPPEEISPAADEAMRKLVELFSDPAVASQARFRCSTEGPTEVDVRFESIIDEQFNAYRSRCRCDDPEKNQKKPVTDAHSQASGRRYDCLRIPGINV